MKLRNKLAAITAATMLAFTGIGFAAWTFTNTVNANSTASSGVVAAIEAKQLDVDHNALYLICDAPTAGGTNLIAGNDVYWSTENSNDPSKKVTSIQLTGKVNQNNENILDFSGYTGHFDLTFNAPSVSTYVTFASAVTSVDVDVNSVNGDCVYNYTLPVPSYTNPALFTNVAAVTAMKDSLTGMSFAFTFNVKAVA